MIISETSLRDAFIIDIEKIADDRGFYARAWCKETFDRYGMNTSLLQTNISYTAIKGTMRGMHYQTAPYQEAKILRCTRGSIFDVIIDLRSGSRTFKQWFGVELSADNRRMVYVPEGFANGFVSMDDDTEVIYSVTETYHPECEKGLRYDDPTIGIDWPVDVRLVSEKDKNWPAFNP